MCHSWDPLSKPWGLHVRYFPSCGAGVSSPERPGGVSDVHKVTQLVFKPWFADGTILTVPFRDSQHCQHEPRLVCLSVKISSTMIPAKPQCASQGTASFIPGVQLQPDLKSSPLPRFP